MHTEAVVDSPMSYLSLSGEPTSTHCTSPFGDAVPESEFDGQTGADREARELLHASLVSALARSQYAPHGVINFRWQSVE